MNSPEIPYNGIQCMELIVSTVERRGEGTEQSPIRCITKVYTKSGTLIAEYDPNSKTLEEYSVYIKEAYENGRNPKLHL